MSYRECTHGLVGPSGATDPQARLRLLLQLGAEENARTTSMQSAIRKRRLPQSLDQKDEQLPRVGVGRGRLVIGVSGRDDTIVAHCGSLPMEMLVRKVALEGLRYALLVHLVVFSDWFLDSGYTESELLARIPSAAVALELSLTPRSEELCFGTFAKWNDNILRWFPSKSSTFDVVRRDVLLPSTAPPGCMLPEGVASTDVQWHVIDIDLNALEEWSKSIETKAKQRFAWVWRTLVEGHSDEAIEEMSDNVHSMEW